VEAEKEKKEGNGEKEKKKKEPQRRNTDGEKPDEDLVEVEDGDDYLHYLEDVLSTIHKAYYDLLDQMKEEGKETVPDLKTVIPYVKRKVLQGVNLVFSGVVPTHIPIRKSRAYMVARSLGANVSESINVDSPNAGERTVRCSQTLIC
jgi:RNA polymerase II subunit A-like phosphatase